jgi:hypothetical protein
MELVPPLPFRGDQPRLLQDFQVLRDRLPGGGETVLHRETRTDLEQRLAIALDELVQDRPPGGICEGPEHVAHGT